MAILLVAIIIVLIAATAALTLRDTRPNPAAVLLCLLAITACAGFTGFLLGDVRASYMGASIDRAIDETHRHLTAGHCDAVTDAYQHTVDARDWNISPHQSIGFLIGELRAIPDTPAATPASGGIAAP